MGTDAGMRNGSRLSFPSRFPPSPGRLSGEGAAPGPHAVPPVHSTPGQRPSRARWAGPGYATVSVAFSLPLRSSSPLLRVLRTSSS